VAEDRFTELRAEMVEKQLRKRDVKDERVLRAMETVARHEFVPDQLKNLAYTDEPLGIGDGQTISQPYIVAAMTEALNLSPNAKVLDVGTGCGYQAAILASLVRDVYSIEYRPDLARAAADRLHRLGYLNVHVFCGDGSMGLLEFAPYDAILVAAAAPHVPKPLLEQLDDSGRLIAPLGTEDRQNLVLVTRHGAEFVTEQREPCRFVPLLGKYGWQPWELM